MIVAVEGFSMRAVYLQQLTNGVCISAVSERIGCARKQWSYTRIQAWCSSTIFAFDIPFGAKEDKIY